MEELSKSSERVIIPTPALSEALVGASGAIDELVTRLSSGYKLKIESFDEMAAIEVALMTDKDKLNGGLNDETKAKVKYDRQILVIAKVKEARAIYTDDCNLRKKAVDIDLEAYGLEDVELPPEHAQHKLDLTNTAQVSNDGQTS